MLTPLPQKNDHAEYLKLNKATSFSHYPMFQSAIYSIYPIHQKKTTTTTTKWEVYSEFLYICIQSNKRLLSVHLAVPKLVRLFVLASSPIVSV
ncbi:hypothetical protein DERF_015030 [Dermatophagoides farinae]|uniref:Uncharacterized protein n=1 Tax=Dermatophagoides farinae TaxID=6954 RepID=A0A922KZV4_DERFA|nr:hypothetical protein DERF_015030 [Dermatophagoides farinae]